jgi:hypothetical protein
MEVTHLIPWAWLAHQWWFIAALLLLGLVASEVARGEEER